MTLIHCRLCNSQENAATIMIFTYQCKKCNDYTVIHAPIYGSDYKIRKYNITEYCCFTKENLRLIITDGVWEIDKLSQRDDLIYTKFNEDFTLYGKDQILNKIKNILILK